VKSLKALNQTAVTSFQSSRYTAQNMVLSISGAEAPNAETDFKNVASGSLLPSGGRIDFTGAQMNIRDDTVHNAQVLMAYETTGLASGDWAPLQILQALLGDWEKTSGLGDRGSTRLSEVLASEKLVDRFTTFNWQSTHTGLFGIYFDTHSIDHLDDAVFEVFNEYQKLFSFLYAGDLTRAKAQVITRYLSSISNSTGQACDNGKQVSSFGRRMPPSEFVARINAVSLSDVGKVLDTYFHDVDPVVVAHGPLEEMPDFGILRSWTYWNRR